MVSVDVPTMKGIAAAILFIAAFVGGLLPFLLKQRSKANAANAATAAASHAHSEKVEEEKPRHKSMQGEEIVGVLQPVPYSPPSPQLGTPTHSLPPQVSANAQAALQQPILASTTSGGSSR